MDKSMIDKIKSTTQFQVKSEYELLINKIREDDKIFYLAGQKILNYHDEFIIKMCDLNNDKIVATIKVDDKIAKIMTRNGCHKSRIKMGEYLSLKKKHVKIIYMEGKIL